jgi:hypothetical protein
MFASVLAPIMFQPRAFSAAAVQTGANTTETVLQSYTIPADTFAVNGKRINYRFWGAFAANANLKTIRIRLGPVTLTGTVLYTSLAGAFNAQNWQVEGFIARRILDGQAGPASWICGPTAPAGGIVDVEFPGAANDDGAAMLLECTGQNGSASAGDITLNGHMIDLVQAPP